MRYYEYCVHTAVDWRIAVLFVFLFFIAVKGEASGCFAVVDVNALTLLVGWRKPYVRTLKTCSFYMHRFSFGDVDVSGPVAYPGGLLGSANPPPPVRACHDYKTVVYNAKFTLLSFRVRICSIICRRSSSSGGPSLQTPFALEVYYGTRRYLTNPFPKSSVHGSVEKSTLDYVTESVCVCVSLC